MIERNKAQRLKPAEVVIVVFMCLFLLAVVPAACRRVRRGDYEPYCSTNLSVIGKAMMIYANDYDDKLPRSAGRNSEWNVAIQNWRAPNRYQAYGITASGEGGIGSISSCFYLLVKYAEVTPKTFVCPQDSGTSEFRPADDGAAHLDLIDLWDFGPVPMERCSYSYHMPFSKFALTMSSEPGMAVAADRNPFIESPMAEAKTIAGFNPDGGREAIKKGNAVPHDEEGQNVLFLDGHVSFEKAPYCGVKDDNIYTHWDGGDIRRGAQPGLGSKPVDRLDSLLVHDGQGVVGWQGSNSSGESRADGVPPPKGRPCFLADTPVWIDGALVPICEVVAGQAVRRSLCAVPRASLDRVERLQEHTGTFECRDIVLESGNHIAVVGAHCFMLASGDWIAAQDLKGGLSLRTLQGTVRIKSVAARPEPYTARVYNLKIKNSQKYVVGGDAVIVRDY
ncbi:MAG: Hint domain-containing protein [Planctomycetota bacterium]|jgi:prepilin-type processing-associated H-X9-DG protein